MFELVSEGRYSLMRIIDNPFFAFVVYVISSVLFGCILHFIVKYIKNILVKLLDRQNLLTYIKCGYKISLI